MVKKNVIQLVLFVTMVISTLILIAIGVWVAPYAVGLFQTNGGEKFHILFGILLYLLNAIIIILLCKKHLRIYALPLIPHVIALFTMFVYVGFNKCVYYMGDGFVEYSVPTIGLHQIRTSGGKVILNDVYIEKTTIDGVTLFVDHNSIYDSKGSCILKEPSDDHWLRITNNSVICSEGAKGDYCRIRLFDLYGKYIVTRLYDESPLTTFSNQRLYEKGDIHFYDFSHFDESKEYIYEYREDVQELTNGIKIFAQQTN